MQPVKKAVKWVLIVFGSLALMLGIYIEAFLITSTETGFTDILSVASINMGADYAVISTSGSGRDVSQTVMTKDYDKLKVVLSKHGCTKISQNGNFYYDYKTKNGKEFTVYTKTEVPGGVYTTFTFEGATMEEITKK